VHGHAHHGDEKSAVIGAKLPLVITHSPGYMFVTDLYNSELREQAAAAADKNPDVTTHAL
jgi:hypothetical protein